MNDWHDAEDHVERAHEFYEAGRWDDAESELRKALDRNPYQAEWHFNLGLTLDAAGRHSAAASAFEGAFDLMPDDPQSALMVGVSLLRADQPSDSLRWLERVHDLDAENVPALVHRIEAHTRLSQHEQAEFVFYLAQQVDELHPEPYAAIADSLLARGLNDRAMWCLREAAKLDPDLPGVQGRLAECYAATGRHERARQLFLRELRRNPGDVDTLLDLGCLLSEMNRLEEAGEKFRRVLEMEPDNPDAHFYLGELAERAEKPRDAQAHYDVVIRLDASYPGVRRRLASLRLGSGVASDRDEAVKLLRRELAEARQSQDEIDPDDVRELGALLIEARLVAEAARLLQHSVQRKPGDARLRHLLSVARFELGDRSRGISEARRVVRVDPRCVAAMHNLAMANMHERRWLRARYWLRQARRVDPDDAALRRLHLLLVLRAMGSAAGAPFRLRNPFRRK